MHVCSLNRALRRGVVMLAILTTSIQLAACGGEPTRPEPRPGITVVALATGTDTIMALPADLLTVEVRDASGEPVAGARVEFSAPILPGEPDAARRTMFVCGRSSASCATFSETSGSASHLAIATTDGDGRASARVQHGIVAGAGRIDIAAPAFGYAATGTFTTRPGALARIAGTTLDTAVYIAGTVQLNVTAADRFGNARPEPVTLESSASGVVSLSGGIATGVSPGRAAITARAGGVTQIIHIGVVPAGRLVFATSALQLMLVNTNGTARRQVGVTTGHVGYAWPSWSNDGRVLFRESGHGFALDSTSGARTPLVDVTAFTFSGDAVFTASGDAMYFFGRQAGSDTSGIFRAAADGSGAQLVVASAAGPSPSPDGTRLAYAHFASRSAVVQDLASGTTTAIAATPYNPFWSPAGDWIAYMAMNAANTLELWVVRPDGTGRRKLSDVTSASSWSPDGQWIAITSYGIGAEIVRIADGLRIPIPGGRSATQVSWRP